MTTTTTVIVGINLAIIVAISVHRSKLDWRLAWAAQVPTFTPNTAPLGPLPTTPRPGPAAVE